MALWAGIDEAGYGPLLGPLVVSGTVFRVSDAVPAREGFLWAELKSAVARGLKSADGRVVVDDSKRLYNRTRGIRVLEEGVLSFLGTLGVRPASCGQLFAATLPPHCRAQDGAPWWSSVPELPLPRRSNASALASKTADLLQACRRSGTSLVAARAEVVLPAQFNQTVERTGNKATLLFQKCGALLRAVWEEAEGEDACVLVDRHGGRMRYRRLLKDAFPECSCDIVREEAEGSVYRITDGPRTMVVGFKEGAEARALPVALASMTAKYLRELYMEAFNAYWQGRMEGLRPTAGYARDARRFLADIEPLLRGGQVDLSTLVRTR